MKISPKHLIPVLIVAAIAVAFYLTKPGGDLPSQPEIASGPSDERPAQPPSPEPEDTAPPPPKDSTREASGDAGAADGGRADAGNDAKPASQDGAKESAATSTVTSGHGEDAVVRAGEGFDKAKLKPRKLISPNWSSPIDMGFRQFKALRRRFRQNGDFPDEDLKTLHGAAVLARGAIMPIDPVPSSGELKRFWLANPIVVMAGCVFCNPPTMGDLLYIDTKGSPLEVDRERLYRSVVNAKLLGRLKLGPGSTKDGVEYMFSLELKERVE